jgi:hypothetical protein
VKIVPINLDKERHIRVNYNAIRLFEAHTGHTVSTLSVNPSFTDISSLLHASLVWEDKDLTIEKLCDILDEYSDWQEVQLKLAEGLNDLLKRKNS